MKDCTESCYGPGDDWYSYNELYRITAWALLGIVVVSSLWWIGLCVRRINVSREVCVWLRGLKFSCLRAASLHDTCEIRVQLMYKEKCLKRLQTNVRTGLLMCPVILAILAWLCYMALMVDASYMRGAFVEAPLGEVLLVILGILCFNTFPSCFSLALSDIFVGTAFLLIGIHSPAVRSNYGYVSSGRSAIFCHFVLAVFMSDMRRAMVPNLLNFVFQVCVIVMTPALEREMPVHLCVAAGSTIMVWWISMHTTSWMLAEARALVQAKESALSEATATSLLAMMSDAVVSLNSDLTLREPSPKLNHLLMRGSVIRDSVVPFSSYIHEADVTKFTEFICEDPGEGGHLGNARALPVRLVDSIGNLVSVDLHHTTVLDYDGQLNHLIGISERQHGAADYFPSIQKVPAESVATLEGSEEERGARLSQSNSSTTVSSWGSAGLEARIVLKAKLIWKVMEESAESRQLFGFTTEAMGFADRFEDPAPIRWLEALMMSGRASRANDAFHYGLLSFYNPGTSCNYEAMMKARVEDPLGRVGSTGRVVVHLVPPETRREDFDHRRRQSLRRMRSMLAGVRYMSL